jgi:hypothetical protein
MNPHRPMEFVEPAKLADAEFTGPQMLPERSVLGPRAFFGIDEDGVVLADHFLFRVPHQLQERPVGAQHGAVEREFNHRLRSLERFDLVN